MRKHANITQGQLADMIGLVGVDQTVVSAIEFGRRKINPLVFAAWHRACGAGEEEMSLGVSLLLGVPLKVAVRQGA